MHATGFFGKRAFALKAFSNFMQVTQCWSRLETITFFVKRVYQQDEIRNTSRVVCTSQHIIFIIHVLWSSCFVVVFSL